MLSAFGIYGMYIEKSNENLNFFILFGIKTQAKGSKELSLTNILYYQ